MNASALEAISRKSTGTKSSRSERHRTCVSPDATDTSIINRDIFFDQPGHRRFPLPGGRTGT